PAVTSNRAVCCTLNPPVLPLISPKGVKVPVDDELMWAGDHVVASTPGSVITIPETANKFAIKAAGIFLYKTPNQAYQLLEDKVLLKLWAKNQKTKSSLKKTIAFDDEGNSNSDTNKIMARIDAMTIKKDAQCKELQSCAKQPTPDLEDDDISMSCKEEATFMQTFHKTRFYYDYRDRDSNRDNWHSNGRNDCNRDNCRSNTDDKSYDLQIQFNDFMKSQQSTNAFVKETFMDLKTQLETVAKNHQASIQNLETKFDRLTDKQSADLGASINLMPCSLYAKLSLETLKPTKMSVRLTDGSFPYPVGIAKNMLVEVGKFTFLADFVILEMEEDSKDDTCFNIDEILEEDFDALLDEGSKILHSIERTFLEEEIFSEFEKFIAMTADENYDSESDTKEPPFEKITINTDYKIKTSFEEPPTDVELKPLPDNLEYVFLDEPSFLPVIISSQLSAQNKSKLVLDDKKQVVQKQRLNPNMQEVVKKEIVKLLDTGIIYPITDNTWVSPIHCVPKKGGITVVINKNDELVPTRTVTGWRVCIDYRKLNEAIAKDHFPLSFMDQMLERLAGNKYFYFLDGFSRYFQILIDPNDQEKTTFTCPFEVFMDDFSFFGNSFIKCLNNLDKMLQHCKDAHLVLNWEKCHFMIKEGIVLGHKVSGAGLEVDKAKIDVISKLPPLLTSKVLEAF
nr:DNA-directed DNA polymerase [Tanacetum cinerariifolium]